MPKLTIPSRMDVEACIEGLGIEDRREQEALRRFYERERSVIRLTGRQWAKVAFWSVIWGLVLWGVITLALAA